MGNAEIEAKDERPYGMGDASYRAAGGEAGIRELVDAFYGAMDRLAEAATIRAMHPQDLSLARDKLARFLCGWLGGPNRYAEKYGPIRIPQAHARFAIGPAERDAWLSCMAEALKHQPYAPEFKRYLLEQLRVPAERSRNRD